MKKLTPYQLRCGYIQHKEGGSKRVELYHEACVYQVVFSDYSKQGNKDFPKFLRIWETFDTYFKDAYEKAQKQYQMFIDEAGLGKMWWIRYSSELTQTFVYVGQCGALGSYETFYIEYNTELDKFMLSLPDKTKKLFNTLATAKKHAKVWYCEKYLLSENK